MGPTANAPGAGQLQAPGGLLVGALLPLVRHPGAHAVNAPAAHCPVWEKRPRQP